MFTFPRQGDLVFIKSHIVLLFSTSRDKSPISSIYGFRPSTWGFKPGDIFLKRYMLVYEQYNGKLGNNRHL
jgi:hypothetical protein